ncbi:MAG: PTS sugar transporter subunit IIA [Verrucomicrobiota bacterium]|jgi:mannitol/fructose-specific phosphotransferase system IIA component (Ntr-type)
MSTNLGDILSEGQVITNLRATNRWEAIEELIANLVETGKVKSEYRDGIIAAVRKRESSMSTGIGHGIGIPHASTDLVSTITGAFGRSQTGIDFDALDGQPVKLTTLLLVPQQQFQQHLHTVGGIAKLFSDAKLREALETAADAAAILRIIRHPKTL